MVRQSGVQDRISTERLVLRRPATADDAACFAIHGDPRAARFRSQGPDPTIEVSRATLMRWIAHWDAHGYGPWTVEHDAQVIGFGGLRMRGEDEIPGLNLYFRFRPESWGNGFAVELARASVRIAFEEKIADAVTAIIRPENAPSIRVVEKIGMRFDRRVVFHGEPSLLYVIESTAVGSTGARA
jgi:RimJ/RimL family protein N-acetyltransferase